MRYMLDTNICIYAIKRKPQSVLQHILAHSPADICISSITYAELCHGVEKSMAREKNELALLLFLSAIEIMPFDEQAAAEYGKIRAALERRGTPIGGMDMLIAAHARIQGMTIVTNNAREFARVDDLQIENWAEESLLETH